MYLVEGFEKRFHNKNALSFLPPGFSKNCHLGKLPFGTDLTTKTLNFFFFFANYHQALLERPVLCNISVQVCLWVLVSVFILNFMKCVDYFS